LLAATFPRATTVAFFFLAGCFGVCLVARATIRAATTLVSFISSTISFNLWARAGFAISLDFEWLSPAQATGKEQNQTDEQDETKRTSAYQWSTEIKSAAAKQEHQHN
jgi:hypothetical protein